MQIDCIAGGILNANTYVLHAEDARDAIVIDPTDAERLERYLTAQNLSVTAVLLTHGHFDHICGLPDLLRKRQVPVYLHPDDGPMLSDPILCGLHLFFPDEPFEPIREFLPLSDGQELTLAGLSVTVWSTPGHSRGSVCYLIDGVLFSGDTLFQDGFGRTDLWGGSQKDLIASLSRLRELPADTDVYPGHGGQTAIEAELLRE